MLRTVLFLIGSNLFMTTAWYGHLRFRGLTIGLAILFSWLIALPEYALQVPANRLGFFGAGLSGFELKILQEAISISIFILFAVLILKETLSVRHVFALVLIFAGVAVAFYKR